jgi:hypothetical protein
MVNNMASTGERLQSIIRVREEKTTCNTKLGKAHTISNLDRQIQLEEAIEQRRALTNRTLRLRNDGLRDTPTKHKKSPFAYAASCNERVDAPFTKEMATDGRCHVLTRIPKTDSAVQTKGHAASARPRRGGILGSDQHGCLTRKRPCRVKRFEGR